MATRSTDEYNQIHRDCPRDSAGLCVKRDGGERLVPHRCPVCTGDDYYGRLARPGTRETCPNHVTVSTDPDTGDKLQTVELVYLVEVAA